MIPSSWIKRFHKTEIMLHWANAVPFVILILTGFYLALEGLLGIQRSSFFSDIHKIMGIALIFLPPIVSLAGKTDVILKDLKSILTFGQLDKEWIAAQKAKTHSAQGKFNFGQKINALASLVNSILLQLTGIWLWVAPQGMAPRWLHTLIACGAVFLVMGHLFMAIVNPSTKKGLPGMFNGGFVPRDYMEEHHSLQLHEIESQGANEK